MENFDELLKKYADFIVRVGVNPQPGQTLIINCPLEGAPLAPDEHPIGGIKFLELYIIRWRIK